MDQSKKIKLWSSLGMRATFGMVAMDLAEKTIKNPKKIT